MRRYVVGIVVLSLLLSGSVSAFAGCVERTSVSESENAALNTQQAESAPQVEEVVAGGEGTTVLAAVGVTLLVLIVIGAAAGA